MSNGVVFLNIFAEFLIGLWFYSLPKDLFEEGFDMTLKVCGMV